MSIQPSPSGGAAPIRALGPVERKVLLPVLAAAVVAVGVVAFATWKVHDAQRERQLASESQLIARAIADAELRQPEALQGFVENLGEDPRIGLVVAVNGEPATVFASSQTSWIGRPLAELPSEEIGGELAMALETGKDAMRMRADANLFACATPLEGDGAVVVHIDASPFEEAALRGTLLLGVLAAAVVVAFAAVVVLTVRRTVTLRLARLARAFAPGAQPPQPEDLSPKGGDDEIVDLGRAISASRAREARDFAEIERLALVARRTTNAVIITDLARRIVWVNEGFTRLTGYEADEAIGRVPGEILQCPRSDAATIARMGRALAAHEPCRIEIVNRAKDGREYWLDIEIQPLRDADGAVTGFMAIEADITAAVAAREAIAASERRQRLIVEGANLGTWEWDIDTGEVRVNERWHAMLGYGPDEVEPNIRWWRSLIHDDDRAAVVAAIEDHFAGRTDFYRSEHRIRHRDGSSVWILDAGKVYERDGDGRPLRMSGIHLDVNERREKREFEKLAALLARQNRSLEEMTARAHRFVDDVSHEFRTPLTVIKEYTAIVADGLGGPVTPQQAEWLQIVDVAAADLNQMVEDFLDSSKLRVGRLRVDRRPASARLVVEGVRSMVARKAAARGIRVLERVEEGLPAVFVDEEKVRRIVMNLMSNAIKFSPDGGVVELAVRALPAGDIEFRVSDQGPGLSLEDQSRLFERFRQLPNALAPSVKGFGLGLNIARQLVWLNLGRIRVESEPGCGATFSFTVPPADMRVVIDRFFERLAEREDVAGAVAMLRVEPGTGHADVDAEQLRRVVVGSTWPSDIALLARDGRSIILVGPTGSTSVWIARIEESFRRHDLDGPHAPRVSLEGLWAFSDDAAAARAAVRATVLDAEAIDAE